MSPDSTSVRRPYKISFIHVTNSIHDLQREPQSILLRFGLFFHSDVRVLQAGPRSPSDFLTESGQVSSRFAAEIRLITRPY